MEGVKQRRARLAAAVLVGGASLVAAVATAGAYEPVGSDFRISNLGSDFRISNVGTDGDAARDGSNPAVAYNATANEYLVTWQGDGLATDDEFEIFGQRASAAGAEVGADFRISNVGTDTDAARGGFNPAVAYNPTADEYLVTWQGDGLATDDEFEIFGRRVAIAPPPGGGVDTSPPNTTITAGPKAKTKKKNAKFEFTSTEPGSTFECKLDKQGFAPCSSPKKVKAKPGKHSFQVRAKDAAGNVDPTPATRSWKVKKKRKK